MTSTGELLILAVYYTALALLTVYALHRIHLVRIRRKHAAPRRGDTASFRAEWPSLAVQLPLYNEPNVAARLIDAAAALQYPGQLELQVLDDSTDETTEIVARRVAAARLRGVAIRHIRRGSREGYKAGALAHGMRCSDAELFAIFDADFLPDPDVLLHLVPPFADPAIGMVQARWAHLNREDSALTRVQAIYLDAHFAVESAARYLDAMFLNFNGTAGVWRKQAIVDAGGWSASTLTEDLDLSYRAQLAGWRFVFLPHVEVAAELPPTLPAFEGQQRRWAKGSIQTARKLLLRIIRSRIPARQKVEAAFHLTANVAYVLTLLLALLVVPVIEIRYRAMSIPLLAFDLALFLFSTGSLLVYCREGQRLVAARRSWTDLLLAFPVGVGLCVANSAAVLEGLVSRGGEFHRTPKSGDSPRLRPEKAPRLPIAELILALFFLATVAIFATSGRHAAVLFPMLFLSAFAHHLMLSLLEWQSYISR